MENPTSSVSIAQIEQSREQMHKRIDAQYDGIVQKMLMNGNDISLPKGHKIMSMATNPARFKGTKPVSICFPDGRMTAVKKWRLAILEVLWDCNHDPGMHQSLMDLRGKVNGRLRPILSKNPVEMDVPLMIDDELYLEGKLDTEFILKIVKRDILDCVGYDYSGIGIAWFRSRNWYNARSRINRKIFKCIKDTRTKNPCVHIFRRKRKCLHLT